MATVFISYAHEDEAKARKVKERLEKFGFGVWIDRSAPTSKDDISTVIDAKLGDVDAVLVLWSGHSNKSVWVRGEALKGLEGNKYFGLLLQPMVPPVPFNALAAPDLSDWNGLNDHLGWNALVRGLSAMSKTSSAILQKLDAAQLLERDETARLANKQEALPLEEPREELDQGPAYGDVELIVSEAKAIMGSSARLDLRSALAEATLDREMLRDAAFVVSKGAHVERPPGSKFHVVDKVQTAIDSSQDGDLIVVCRGEYEEAVNINKNVRVVGLGRSEDRPIIKPTPGKVAVNFATSARIENVAIETRVRNYAVHCERGQPVVLRCDIRRFSDSRGDADAAFYVAGKANPIVIGTSVASTGCRAFYFVGNSGGQFIGAHIVSMRGNGVTCRGRPVFQGCTVEAIGGHALEVLGWGSPTFEECDISGRGATVVRVVEKGYPKIRESRVKAIRQLAFDFDGDATGRYEGNIVSVERDKEAGTGRKSGNGFFGLLKSKENAIVEAASRSSQIVRLRGKSKPLFISNTTSDGKVLAQPGNFANF